MKLISYGTGCLLRDYEIIIGNVMHDKRFHSFYTKGKRSSIKMECIFFLIREIERLNTERGISPSLGKWVPVARHNGK